MLTKEQLEQIADNFRKDRELHNEMVKVGLAEGTYEDALAKKTSEILSRMMGDGSSR